MSDKEPTLRRINRPPTSSGEGQFEATAAPWDDGILADSSTVDHSKTNVPRPDTSRKRPVLITLDGRRVSERFVLAKEESVIGRDVHADIIIADGEISRRHACIHWRNKDGTNPETPDCWVRDMGSTNGTHVNGVQTTGETQLKDGDLVRVGRTVIGFFLKDERVLELDQLLLNMALHDSLTGLYKREFFFSELHREFDRSKRHERPLSILLMDIDHFKSVNDQYGHLRGDEALRQFAGLIRLSLREGDICGRYGGEEFGVVLPETDGAGAMLAAERIRSRMEEHLFQLGGDVNIRITTSVGVATLCDHHIEKMQLLDDADQALYKAKSTGRNRSVMALPRSKENTQTGTARIL